MDPALPQPDQIEGAPHPSTTQHLFGQDAAEAAFLAAFNADRLHSGWLVTGPRGIGKATLAYRIARFLLATPPATDGLFGAPPPTETLDIAADHPDAQLILAGAHPRLFVLKRGLTDKGDRLASTISVDVVRGLKGFFQLSAADGGRRVVIVDSADEMNTAAANALLKELEEPPANTTLLLISHQPSRLLPTIRSRCRELRCQPLGPDAMTAALTQLDHTPSAPEALSVLAAGSVGDALRMSSSDGLALYEALVKLLSPLPQLNRPAALKLADSCTGRAGEARFALLLDLIDLFLARAARAGLMGEPSVQGAPGEARLLAAVSPHDHAARRWAALQQHLSDRVRHGRAVNLDPAALTLDLLLQIEKTAQSLQQAAA